MSPNMVDVSAMYNASSRRLSDVGTDGFWDSARSRELNIHKIHPYPAKFPAFLVNLALEYAKNSGMQPKKIADIFCGCGTVAYEAKRENIDFWGCDINPVATLIAKVKSLSCDPELFLSFLQEIELKFAAADAETGFSLRRTNRLMYWFSSAQYRNLAKLLNSINAITPEDSIYRSAYLCAFSAILKSTSQWRRRSIKPQLDKEKIPADVLAAFSKQCRYMAAAWSTSNVSSRSSTQIIHGNINDISLPCGEVDLIITSPPYATSYEYADLHQLSSLWLGYVEDYRELRLGSIGSAANRVDLKKEIRSLNEIAYQIVFSIYAKDPNAAKATARYYLDMQSVANRCHSILRPGGIAFFVIGDTQQHDVQLDNAAHLTESLMKSGFDKVFATKRRISNKSHTPFRDNGGRFSPSKLSKSVYSEEYILIAHR